MEIALIDRHPIIRKGLKDVLNSHFKKATILESKNIIHFHESFPNQVPDLVIMGVCKSRGENDLGFISMAKKWYPKGNVIVYDEEFNLNMISQYLNTGVSGYLSKAAGVNELIDCVNNVITGKKYLSSEALLWLLNTYIVEKKRKPFNKPKVELTQREFQIAEYLADGMKISWIANKLSRKPSTISTIKINIYKKLKVDNVVELRNAFQPLRR